MALDLSSIQISQKPHEGAVRLPGAPASPLPQGGTPKPGPEVQGDLKSAIHDLQRVSEAFNRRLSFSLNEKLGQVVVKVIDADTDKVVREIPPKELQRVYERIREVIGLLIDKSA
jgi:uncharacterized FlaG/YvyC family protein